VVASLLPGLNACNPTYLPVPSGAGGNLSMHLHEPAHPQVILSLELMAMLFKLRLYVFLGRTVGWSSSMLYWSGGSGLAMER